MSISPSNPDLTIPLPLDRIRELCQKHGVSQLFVQGPVDEDQSRQGDELRFLVEFLNDDFGPWGCKLDLLENDLSGVMHRKVHVASRRGVRQSSLSPRREQVLDSARLIYES